MKTENPQIHGNLNEGTLKLIQKWNALAHSIQTVLENDTDDFRAKIKELKAFHKVVDEYSGFLLKPMKLLKASQYLESALETFHSVITQARELEKWTLSAFSEKNLKKVVKELDSLKGLKEYTGENIVHVLY